MTDKNEISVGVPKDNDSNTEVPRLKVYKRRWFILSIICSIISVRSFNQSFYGPINNILSDYFQVHPWQIDWLNGIHPFVFLVLSFPMLLVSTKFGFRLSVIAMGFLEIVSYFSVTLGVSWRNTFPLALIGQVTMGLSTILSSSIPPATAAIWFPKNEVATVVGIHVVARGIGEAIGCVVPNLVLRNSFTPDDVLGAFPDSDFQLGVFAFSLLMGSCVLILVGLKVKILKLSFSGVLLQGFFTGMSKTALYELYTEIIYPISPRLAYKTVMVLTGFFMLLYIIVGRLLLTFVGPLSSIGLFIATAGLGLIAMMLTKPTYFREQANQTNNEETPLVDSAQNN